MLNLFKNEEKEEIALFSIEHYPLSNKYYPKYKKGYINRNYSTGILGIKDSFEWASVLYFSDEESARKIIEEFKEQEFKETVKTIKVE